MVFLYVSPYFNHQVCFMDSWILSQSHKALSLISQRVHIDDKAQHLYVGRA